MRECLSPVNQADVAMKETEWKQNGERMSKNLFQEQKSGKIIVVP